MRQNLPYGAEDAVTFTRWLFERLREIPDISWDESQSPVHTSYEDYYVWGFARGPQYSFTSTSPTSSSTLAATSPSTSTNANAGLPLDGTSPAVDRVQIVGRVSKHVLRLERQYQIGKQLLEKVDPAGDHHQRCMQLFRLVSRRADEPAMSVIIGEVPGVNHFRDLTSFGPNWYKLYDFPSQAHWHAGTTAAGRQRGQVALPEFLEFAIGACQCLEMLHQGNQTVHGELRGDSVGSFDSHARFISDSSRSSTFIRTPKR